MLPITIFVIITIILFTIWIVCAVVTSGKGELEFDRSSKEPLYTEITLLREGKEAITFNGRFLDGTFNKKICVYETEECFYVLTNSYLNPVGVYTFAFPSELKGHIRLTPEIIKLFRGLKKYNNEFGDVVEERLENPFIKELLISKRNIPVKVISRRIEDGEVLTTQRKDDEVVPGTRETTRILEK